MARPVRRTEEAGGEEAGADIGSGRTHDLIGQEQAAGPSPGRFKVAELDEIADGGSKIVNVQGRSIALFRVKDQYFALGNNCLHRGGPLGEGEVRNYEVTCPWHGWRYGLLDGSFSLIPTLKVETYPVRAEPEGVFIEV